MLKCFWKYLLKVRQVKNRQFRKQYARTQLEKKRRRWYNAESEIFSRKIILCASCIAIKCGVFETPSYFGHLRSFTTGLVRFYRKNYLGTRGTGKVYTFSTVRCVIFGTSTASGVSMGRGKLSAQFANIFCH